MKSFLTSTLLFICVFAKSQTPDLIWKVTTPDGLHTSYLVGVIHFSCEKDSLEQKTKKTSLELLKLVTTIYFEPEDDLTLKQKWELMSMDSSIKELYEKEEFKEIKSCLEKNGIPVKSNQNMMPVWLVSFINTDTIIFTCKSIPSIESELEQNIKKQQLKFLETSKMTFDYYKEIPIEFQLDLLKRICTGQFTKTLNTINQYTDISMTLEELMKLTFLGFKEIGGDQLAKNILINRNLNWVKKIEPDLNRESIMVVAGAAHLGGETGLINQLMKKGFNVEPYK